jgi:hypothetical protein
MDFGRGLTRRQALAGGGSLVLAGSASAETDAGWVEAVRGEGYAQRAAERLALQQNSRLFVNDRVETGGDSRLGLRLGRTTQVKLGAYARVRIDNFIVNAGGVLELQNGEMMFDRPEGAPPARFSVRSPFALIAVRGTRFFAGMSNGVFGVFVARGSVNVSASGKTVTVLRGQGTNIIGVGGPPSDPTAWGQPRIQSAMASVT